MSPKFLVRRGGTEEAMPHLKCYLTPLSARNDRTTFVSVKSPIEIDFPFLVVKSGGSRSGAAEVVKLLILLLKG